MSETPPSSPQIIAPTDYKQKLEEKMKQALHHSSAPLKINDGGQITPQRYCLYLDTMTVTLLQQNGPSQPHTPKNGLPSFTFFSSYVALKMSKKEL